MKNTSLLQSIHSFFLPVKRVILHVFSILLATLFLAFSTANAQAPHITYASPQVYKTNFAASPLPPTNTGGAVPLPTTEHITGGNPGDNTIVVAVDASGNIYYANQLRDIIEIPANGNQPVVIANGVTVHGLAADAAGNVYFSQGSVNIQKIAAITRAITTVASGLKQPTGIAIDAAGNLYFAEAGGGDVKKIPAGGSAPVLVANGFGAPNGIAVDRSGNVFVADRDSNTVKEILAGSNTVITLSAGSASSDVFDVAVDVFGNVYFVSLGNTIVTEIPVGGGSNIVLGSGFYNTQCIAVDHVGDIFVGNLAQSNGGTSGGQLQKIPAGGYSINPLPPAGLSLSTRTGVISGTPTAASPATNYTVTATNSSGSSTATVNIKVLQGSNKSLSHLTLSNGTLSPAFATATTGYTASVAGTVGAVSLTPITTNSIATVTINGTTVASGSASPNIPLFVGPNTINVVVDSATTETDYTVTVTRAPSPQADLSLFKISRGTLTPAFSSSTTSYTASVANGVSSITVTPTVAYAGATIKVNGTTVASGSPSGAIPLSVGQNTISTVVTSSDGTVTKTYTLVVTEAASANANLTSLKISKGTLSPAYNVNTTGYTVSEPNTVSSITITPTAVVSGTTIKVNGTAVPSGSASQSIPLFPGTNTITTVVTAQDGSTTKTYTITVTEAASANANLSSLKASRGVLSPGFNPNTTSYTASVVNGATSTIITPTAEANGATITVNGTAAASGSPSGAIALSVGANTITTIVTASNGTTTKTYTFTITRAGSPGNIPDEALSVNQPTVLIPVDNDGILVHQAISPNGDGINDFLMIENIAQYPDNKLSIINRNGQLVFEAKGYDNATKVFDGHSNKTGQMQLPGTYFYQLEYTVKGILRHKTGFIILKY